MWLTRLSRLKSAMGHAIRQRLTRWDRRARMRALLRELNDALYDDRGSMLIVVHRTPALDVRASSFTCGTGTRHGDRALVKAFAREYLKVAHGGEPLTP